MSSDPGSWATAAERSPSLLGHVDEQPSAPAALSDVDERAVAPRPVSYEAASGRLDEIVRRLDSGEAGLRETLELCQEGRRLVEYCAGELDAVGRGLEELRLEELVARLEGGRSGG